MPKAPAAELHVYVIATARKVGAQLRRIANDLGLYEASLHRWLKIADRDDGCRGRTGWLVARDESVKLREVRKRNQAPQFTRIAAANVCRRNLVHPLSCNGLHGSMESFFALLQRKVLDRQTMVHSSGSAVGGDRDLESSGSITAGSAPWASTPR